MTMTDDLFFVPILDEAVRSPDPADAMRKAFATIRSLGGTARYRAGFLLWQLFLAKATAEPNDDERSAIVDAAITIAIARLDVELPDSECLPKASTDPPQVLRKHDPTGAFTSAREVGDRFGTLSLLIHRDDERIARLCLDPVDRRFVPGVRPGHFALALDTGRLLWSGAITAAELLWGQAFPKRALTMAADSTASPLSPTRIIPLSVGALALAVYPGVETGSVRLLGDGAG